MAANKTWPLPCDCDPKRMQDKQNEVISTVVDKAIMKLLSCLCETERHRRRRTRTLILNERYVGNVECTNIHASMMVLFSFISNKLCAKRNNWTVWSDEIQGCLQRFKTPKRRRNGFFRILLCVLFFLYKWQDKQTGAIKCRQHTNLWFPFLVTSVNVIHRFMAIICVYQKSIPTVDVIFRILRAFKFILVGRVQRITYDDNIVWIHAMGFAFTKDTESNALEMEAKG